MSSKRERIQKVLAAAGYGSRRSCELMVEEGRVSVNGEIVQSLPVLVKPKEDEIRVDGRKLRHSRLVYFLLHKPKGVVCTQSDPAGRVRAVDLLRGVKERVFPVGRLDMHSTGLLIMTNDGELADLLTHPRYGVEKTYQAAVRGRMTSQDVEKLKRGVWLSEGRTRSARVKVVHRDKLESVLQIRIREGRNRQIRRMLARMGHKVLRLKRVSIGRLSLKGIGPGQFRALSSTEVAGLRKLVRSGGESKSA